VKPLRIGILTPTFLPKCSGAEIFHHNLATHLAGLGHSPVVMAPRALVRKLQALGWNLPYGITPYPANYWSYFKHSTRFALWMNGREMDRLQGAHRFDVWHAVVLYPAGVCLAEWQHVRRVPGLVRAVGDDVKGLAVASRPPAVAAQLGESLPKAQALVALSPGMVDDLAEIGVARERIHVVPNAVDLARFPAETGRRQARSRAGLPPEHFTFLCVARNHVQKDFPTLFRAFRLLVERHPEKRLCLAIAGRGARELRAEADGFGLSPHVHCFECTPCPSAEGPFAVPPQELLDLYLAADVFVISSVLEGFSSAILEAMAARLPILATAAPGIVDQIEEGRQGLLVPCGDAAALARRMENLMADPELRGRLSDAGAATAREYSWPVITRAYVELYEKLIARAPADFHGAAASPAT
jgi:glycosyltransferase involved in cell wall biosynthesis